MIDSLTDSFSLSSLDEMSLTVWPVHDLSSDPHHWIEMAWAARNAALAGMNQERRGWFEGIKCLLLERDLPASKILIQAEGTNI